MRPPIPLRRTGNFGRVPPVVLSEAPRVRGARGPRSGILPVPGPPPSGITKAPCGEKKPGIFCGPGHPPSMASEKISTVQNVRASPARACLGQSANGESLSALGDTGSPQGLAGPGGGPPLVPPPRRPSPPQCRAVFLRLSKVGPFTPPAENRRTPQWLSAHCPPKGWRRKKSPNNNPSREKKKPGGARPGGLNFFLPPIHMGRAVAPLGAFIPGDL